MSLVLSLLAAITVALAGWVVVLRSQLRAWAVDSVTGMPVRRAFYRHAPAAIRRARHPVVVFVDLDRFKAINDRLGHDVGDAVLAILARRIRGAVWPHALASAGRLGGDEFALVLDAPEREAVSALHTLAAAVGEPINPRALSGTASQWTDRPLQVGASIGAITIPHHADLGGALNIAEELMYQAKRAGGGVRHATAKANDPRLAQPRHARPAVRDRDRRARCRHLA